jgi:hypothetical protein
MKLEDLIEHSETVKTVKRFYEILQNPREGKIYVYHEGVVASDKGDEGELGRVSYMVNKFASKNDLMPFQKKVMNDRYIYFFVR